MSSFGENGSSRGSRLRSAAHKSALKRSAAGLQKRSGYLRFSISAKFALFIGALVILFMGLVSGIALKQVEQTQDREINESGIKLAAAITSILPPELLAVSERRQELENLLHRILTSTQNLGLLNIVVRSSSGSLLATGLRQQTILVSSEEEVVSVAGARAGVTILQFIYENQLIRSFRKAIHQNAGIEAGSAPALGQIEILLSAAALQNLRDTLKYQLLSLTAVICIVAALGAFSLGLWLARPIRVLAKDLRQVSLGHFDHQSKVLSNDELGDLGRAFNQMTSGLRKAQEVLSAQKATEHELKLATEIQQRLLPAETPKIPEFEISAFYRPAKEIGGDYYDFIPLSGSLTGFVIGDVSGKGIPGSLVMAMTRSLLRLAARRSSQTKKVLVEVNKTLSADINPGMFVTLLYGVLSHAQGKFQFVRAGHNHPLYYHHRSSTVIELSPRGMALGLDRSGGIFTADLEVQEIDLQAGDLLVLYTDGVTEAKSPAGKDFGIGTLKQILERHSGRSTGDLLEIILDQLDQHQNGLEAHDDITLLILKNAGSTLPIIR